ncbi:Arginine-specific demethylase JMJ22 [Linum perenne]
MLSLRSTLLSRAIRKKKKKKTHHNNPAEDEERRNKPRRTRAISKREQTPAEDEEEEEGFNFNLKGSAPSHSHGVQPLGNLYFNPGAVNSRNPGLGNLQFLSDELVLDILGLLSATQLGNLAAVSKSFYVFANHEPIWRNLVLDELKGGFFFNGSWRSTYIAARYDVSSNLGFAKIRVRDFYSDYLFQSWLCANLEMKPEWLERDNIVRKRGITVDEFVSNFEELNKPVLLEGCINDWPALEKWVDRDYLIKECGDVRFSVGPVKMKLDEYFRYSDQVKEERPLYLFDPKFAEKVPVLDSDYEVPAYFREDLFNVLGSERPDYRWIIMGPAGSGSSFHIDPNSTSAWNAVIKGSKKWILFPPDVVPPGVHPSPDGAEVACPVSIIEWFMNFYSATKKWKKRPVECVCKAGEVIFVPNGWWHLVINLEESIAITQNYVSRRNLLNVLDFLKRPNASELVSGTRDRVNLHDKFKNAVEAHLPQGTIDRLVEKAEETKKAQQKKVSFWESLTDAQAGGFKGFSSSRDPSQSFRFYIHSRRLGIFPDNLTYPFLVKSCSEMSSLEMGAQAHGEIVVHGFENDLFVQNSLVNMYAHLGEIISARRVFDGSLKLDVVSWTSMIAGTMISGYVKNSFFNEAIELFRVLQSRRVRANETVMASVVASCAHLGALELGENAHDYVTMRLAMKEKGVKKPPGYSLIEMDGVVHRFTLGDRTHPEIDRIERTWDEIVKRIRNAGYLGNTEDALFDIDEEEKESAIYRHSEKLAIAFAIMKSSDSSKPIRIVKNLRVCEDCHTATKLISRVYGRELIVRDRNRFHHFTAGACSCNDYW